MTKKSGLAQWKMETHLYANVLGDIQRHAKAWSQDVQKSTQRSRLHIQRAGKQKLKKWHVISSMFHMEKNGEKGWLYIYLCFECE